MELNLYQWGLIEQTVMLVSPGLQDLAPDKTTSTFSLHSLCLCLFLEFNTSTYNTKRLPANVTDMIAGALH